MRWSQNFSKSKPAFSHIIIPSKRSVVDKVIKNQGFMDKYTILTIHFHNRIMYIILTKFDIFQGQIKIVIVDSGNIFMDEPMRNRCIYAAAHLYYHSEDESLEGQPAITSLLIVRAWRQPGVWSMHDISRTHTYIHAIHSPLYSIIPNISQPIIILISE